MQDSKSKSKIKTLKSDAKDLVKRIDAIFAAAKKGSVIRGKYEWVTVNDLIELRKFYFALSKGQLNEAHRMMDSMNTAIYETIPNKIYNIVLMFDKNIL